MKRESSKLRKNDVKNSSVVTEWLERNVYGKLTEGYSKKDDLENQIKGIDCTFSFNGHLYKCDEKAAVAFINKPLRTFAFELSFINKGNEIQEGWLINDKLETDAYLLVWIDGAKKNNLDSIDDIIDIEYALIPKKSILEYLENLGWSKEKLMAKDKRIRESDGNTEMGNIYRYGCKFSYSKQLVEKPINILIPREKLLEMNILN